MTTQVIMETIITVEVELLFVGGWKKVVLAVRVWKRGGCGFWCIDNGRSDVESEKKEVVVVIVFVVLEPEERDRDGGGFWYIDDGRSDVELKKKEVVVVIVVVVLEPEVRDREVGGVKPGVGRTSEAVRQVERSTTSGSW